MINILRDGTIEKSPLEQKKGDRDRTQERKLRQWLGTICCTEDHWAGFQGGESDCSAHPFPVSCWANHLTSLEPTFLSVKCVSGGRGRGATRAWPTFYLN